MKNKQPARPDLRRRCCHSILAMRVVCALLAVVLCVVANNSGQFFFLADWHLDPYYNPDLGPDTYCQNQTEIIINSTIPLSYFQQRDYPGLWEDVIPNLNLGQYGCDAPIALCQQAFVALYLFIHSNMSIALRPWSESYQILILSFSLFHLAIDSY